MVQIIAITNQKGGVGKTTTAINLTASLVNKQKRVLLIDADPQANATTGSGVDKHGISLGLQDVLLEQCDIQNAILQTVHGYDLLPTNSDLTAAEVGLMQQNQRSQVLKQALAQIEKHYDFILIDCPPALNTLTLNALVAAHGLFIPMQCEYFALEGLAALIATMQQVQQHLNSRLKLLGILRTMYDPRSRLCSEVSKQLLQHFGDKVFRVSIPKNVKLAEAPSHGMPVNLYSRLSVGSKAYMVLAEEILAREEVRA
ncbi:MAG: Chromosome partitioning protein [Pseudomonadota bacterium]|nr:Chromosome partitioning protein [Pseudomonadota bacterium]